MFSRVQKREPEIVSKMDEVDAPMPAIQFQIGGQVKTAEHSFNFVNNGLGSITSLDLDDIQPPSEMEGISYVASGGVLPGTNRMESPQMSSLRNRKGLPATLVARRAIAGHTNISTSLTSHHNPGLLLRSVESVASLSHTNLENVAPPSLMDELLDSMISVDSITSEVASDPLKRTLAGNAGESNYVTALSDDDEDDTMTLRSCRDLPLDGMGGGGGSSSNCSSNQSTPVKKRQGSITPKMKREMAKDRFRTYTVKLGPGGEILEGGGGQKMAKEEVQVVPNNATITENGNESEERGVSSPEKSGRVSAKQRRQENRSRFQTQILDYSEMKIFEIAPKGESQANGMPNLIKEGDERPHPMELQPIDNSNSGGVVQKITSPEKKSSSTTTTVIKKTLMKLISKPSSVAAAEAKQEVATTIQENKTLRGKRKQDYVSPYRRPVTTTATGAAAAKGASKPGTPTTPQSAPQTPKKSSGLISKLKMVTTTNSAKKTSPTKGAKNKVEDAGVMERSPKELNRQGTFTKDEPSYENLPKVSSLPATPTRKVSKLPAAGGVRKSMIINGNGTAGGLPARSGVMKRQISAPTGNLVVEKRKSMIVAPSATALSSKSSSGQLSERSTSSASIKSQVTMIKTPMNKPVERKLPLSMPTSRSNSTMGQARTPTAAPTATKLSLYGRAKGLIPVSARK